MSQEAGPAAAGRLNGATTWAKNREKPKPADLRAQLSATPPRPARDPDQTHRAQNGDAALSGLSIRSQQSPAAGPRCPPGTRGGAPSLSSQSRAAAGRQRIGGRHSSREQSNSDAGIGRPAEPGLFFSKPSQAWLQAFLPPTLRVRPPGSRRPRCPLQPAAKVSRRCMGSNAGHDDRLRRGTTQRVGGSGVHLPRLLHR